MPKTTATCNSWLLLLFNNTDFALVGDAAGLQNSAAAGSLYVSYHTSNPGVAAVQTTNEATYTSYARQALARSGAGWTVATNSVSNTAAFNFPTCGVTGNTITHWGIGTDLAGAGALLYFGPLGTAFQGAFTADSATEVFTAPGHTLVDTNLVVFYSVPGTALPVGITEGTFYFVITTVASVSFQVSLTLAGAPINITVSGDGLAYQGTSLTVSTGITPGFAASGLVVTES